MHRSIIIVVSIVCLIGPAAAQSVDQESIPREIGNRANGFSYQPDPRKVRPREVAAGVRPSSTHQAAIGLELEDLDRSLLNSEGLSAANVPRLAAGQ
jgi:hypothetical protein